MRPTFLFRSFFLTASLLPALVAIELPQSAIQQATGELDGILRAAQIDFAPLTHDNARESARSFITDAQKARIAIAQHVVTTTPFKEIGSTLTRAKDLQDQLMGRVQSHLSTQLDQEKGIETLERSLHRGLKQGAFETEDKLFTEQVLRPGKFKDAEEKLAEDAEFKERLAYTMERLRGGLRDINPIAAFRRWRIRRLLKKLSRQPPTSPDPPLAPGVSPSPSDPAPWNMQQLRAKLSSITALKSTQSQFAASDARDASAAALIENAPVIQSDLILSKPLPKPVSQPQKMQYKVINYKDLAGADGQRAPRIWTHTYIKHQGKHVEDWSKIVIPGMA